MKQKLKIYVDGSTNGFDSCICIIVKGPGVKKGLRKQVETLKKKNIEFVEYLAVIHALKFLKETNINTEDKKVIYTDSQQVYQEINHISKPAKTTTPYFKKAMALIKHIKKTNENLNIIKINRKDNLAGKYLEKRLESVKNHVNDLATPRTKKRKNNKKKKGGRRRW